MVSTWEEQTNYYLEMQKDILNTVLNLSDLAEFGYPDSINKIPENVREHYNITDSITLGMLLMTKKELLNGNIAFNIQIRPYDNFLLFSSCTKNMITKADFEKAKNMYDVTEFLTETEYKALKVEEEIVII